MTTIAYTKGVMACDSCWTEGSVQVVSASKITRLTSGALLGQAGDNDAREIEDFLDKIKSERYIPKRRALLDLRVNFAGVWVLPNGSMYKVCCRENPSDYDDEVGFWRVNFPYAAAGSGKEFALGAMAAGRTAAEAVIIACKHDINSRPPVHRVSLKVLK